MKLYLLLEGDCWEGYEVLSVFSTRELAEAGLARCLAEVTAAGREPWKNRFIIEEKELDGEFKVVI